MRRKKLSIGQEVMVVDESYNYILGRNGKLIQRKEIGGYLYKRSPFIVVSTNLKALPTHLGYDLTLSECGHNNTIIYSWKHKIVAFTQSRFLLPVKK